MAEKFVMPPDAEGRSLVFRVADLKARGWLLDRIEETYEAQEFEGCSMLLHAEAYLSDRLAYMLAPWPKGQIKIDAAMKEGGHP